MREEGLILALERARIPYLRRADADPIAVATTILAEQAPARRSA